MQDEQRKESEKAESRECREESYREEAELDRSSDIWNITTEFSLPILSCIHSNKVNSILIGWHVNHTCKFNTKHCTVVLQLCLYAYS